MALKLTKPVPRGTLTDAETRDKLILFKVVSELRATYQIRLLTYRAFKEQKQLVIEIPLSCKVHDDLKAFVDKFPRSISLVRRN